MRLTCLVNNASLFKLDRAPTAKAADFDLHMAVNLRAPLLLSQALARQLPAGETGVIVNMLDQKLFNLNPDFLTYTLSKVGLQGLTTLLAQSFAPRLRVAGIAPGLTLRSGSQTDARFAQQHKQNPLGIGVTTDDLVRALRFIVATPTYHRRRPDRRQRRASERPAARHRLRHEKEEVTWPPTSTAASSSATSGCKVSIGIHDFEHKRPQTVVVNADLLLAPSEKAHGDRIANVLNYDTVHDGIIALAKSRHFNLQETLVDAILDLCLAQPGVIEARVSTEKPDVYGDCRVGYEAVRRRV